MYVCIVNRKAPKMVARWFAQRTNVQIRAQTVRSLDFQTRTLNQRFCEINEVLLRARAPWLKLREKVCEKHQRIRLRNAYLEGIYNNLKSPIFLRVVLLFHGSLCNDTQHLFLLVKCASHRWVHPDVHGHLPEGFTAED